MEIFGRRAEITHDFAVCSAPRWNYACPNDGLCFHPLSRWRRSHSLSWRCSMAKQDVAQQRSCGVGLINRHDNIPRPNVHVSWLSTRVRFVNIKRLPYWAVKRGVPQPKPLRSERFPAGLHGLRKHDQVKVTKANVLVSFTAQVVQHCMDKGISFTVENPSRSLLWWMPEMQALTAR